ncbi:hypothetical protein SAMN05216326_12732 [Nitrosomonas marina]|uniref:Uncharacterized protein n=1 Tax=Nitrosomonas marina TaxID=917 RepID=A0A1I0EHL8_9PROT|nr:hypothetical protein [Nitrosomonas marina]SET44413.1 hypothetical protein SAMN05216326_12732 [Nitrosomonas marina]
MLANFAKETISAGGTGNLTLSGAVDAAHISLNTAIGQNNPFWYLAEDGNDREIGVGHLSAATTLVRDQVHETLNGGTLDRTSPAALDLSTSATISIVAASQTMIAPHYGNFYPASGVQGMCSMGQGAEASSSHTLWNNDLICVPFWWGCSKMVSEVSVRCFTSVATCVARVGIYTIAPNGKPGYLLKEFTDVAEIALDTTGIKTATPAAPFWLPSGFYYMAVIANTGSADLAGPQYAPAGLFMGLDSSGVRILSIFLDTSYGALPSGDLSGNTFTEHNSSPSFWLN